MGGCAGLSTRHSGQGQAPAVGRCPSNANTSLLGEIQAGAAELSGRKFLPLGKGLRQHVFIELLTDEVVLREAPWYSCVGRRTFTGIFSI